MLAALLLTISLAAPPLTPGRVVDGQVCAADREQSYAYYVPRAYDPKREWPLLLVFDPRARGADAAELFREAAEEFGWIVISSNNTRSDADWRPNIRAVNALVAEIPHRFTADRKRIYASGFSGGAILAWTLAAHSGAVAGVIACGGRPADDRPVPSTIVWYGLAGSHDFNYSETYDLARRVESAGIPWRVEIFEGGHRWAPPALLRDAIEWMEIEAMKRGLRSREADSIERAWKREQTLLLEVEAQGDPLALLWQVEAMTRTFDGLKDVEELRARARQLRAATDVRRALSQERKGRELEQLHRRRVTTVIAAFTAADFPRPAAALARELSIDQLKEMARASTRGGAAARRVLETMRVQLVHHLAPDLQSSGRDAMARVLLAAAEEIRQ